MRGKLFRFVWPLALGLLAACNGGPPPSDLSLQGVSPQNPSVSQGQSLSLTLTFTSQNGFQGQVGLQVTEGGQTPTWLSFSPTSANLDVPKGGQRTLNLTIQVSPNAPTGARTLRLRATYGNRTAERDLTLTVTPPPDFTISLDPTSLTVQQGGSGTTQLTLTSQNGFTGNVALALERQDGTAAPSGITLNPTSVTVSGSNPVTQTLTLSVGGSVATGTYNLRVKATAGSLAKTANLSLTVTAGGGGGGGGGGNTSGSVNTGNGTVQVSLQGGTFTQGPQAASVNAPSYQTPYGGIAFTAQVPQGGTLTVTLTFPNPIPQGAVLLKCMGNPQTCNPIPGAQLSGNQATFQVQDGSSLDADGQANGQIVDPVALGVPEDFTLSLNPTSLTVQQGQGGTVTVSLSRSGFTGEVTLSLEGEMAAGFPDPDRVTWSFSPNPATGDTSTLTLQVGDSAPPGTYTLTVRGQAQGLPDRTAELTLTVTGSGGGSDGSTWTPRVWQPNFSEVAYGNGRFVAVGNRQAFFSLDGGESWTPSVPDPNGLPASFYDVVYGNGLFVAVGDEAGREVVYTSQDGTGWTRQFLGDNNRSLRAITYANGLFVAVGDTRIYTSPDGVNWTQRFSPPYAPYGVPFVDVTYGDDKFVAVSEAVSEPGIGVYVSPDGENWSFVSGLQPFSIAYGNGLFVAVRGAIYISTDLVNWTVVFSPPSIYFTLRKVIYANGLFVAVGRDEVGNGVVMTSPDGVNWTRRSVETRNSLSAVAYGGGTFVAVTDQGNIFTSTSPDGANWTRRYPGGEGLYSLRYLRDVVYANGRFVAVGESGMILTSPDGVFWGFRDAGTRAYLLGVAHGAGRFVAVGLGGALVTSTDGLTWTQAPSPTSGDLHSVAYGNGRFAAVGAGGAIFSSPDGLVWTQETSPTANDLYRVRYVAGRFVAVGAQGTLLTSWDGANWTARNTGVTWDLWGVAYGKGRFVVAGRISLTSTDGVNWSPTVGCSYQCIDVTYANGTFVMVGGGSSNRSLLRSSDGVNWSSVSVPSQYPLYGVTYGSGIFVAVGDGFSVGVITSP
jgi:hypothetical protein